MDQLRHNCVLLIMRIRLQTNGGGNSPLTLYFECATCEAELDEVGHTLEHPRYETKFFGGEDKGKPIECADAGCTCLNPLVFDVPNLPPQ